MADMRKCAYCGAMGPESEMEQGDIVFLDMRWNDKKRKYEKYVARKTDWYCADKPCRGNHQMAHEG